VQHTHSVISDFLQFQSKLKIISKQTLARRQSAVATLCECCFTWSLL